MSGFKDFYFNYESFKKQEVVKVTEEQLFFEATKVEIPSLKAFTAWLVLHDHVKPTVKMNESQRPVSIFTLKPSKRVLYLVKELPRIEELAKEFSFKWGG